MIYLLSALLAFVPDYQIHGPGALSYTPVLESVAERRIALGFGLSEIEAGVVLVAPANCAHLGRRGWLIAGGAVHRAQVVDCEADVHRGEMVERGILADVNKPRLDHERGWLILK